MENKEEDYKFMDSEEELNGVMEYEYKNVQECGILDYGFKVKLLNEADYTKWLMLMEAPEDSEYKGGKYLIEVQFFMDYPYINPKFTFKNPILYHCNVKDNGEYAELYSIAVKPGNQGLGIGKKLLVATEEDVAKHNCKISLTTDYCRNEKTIGFYHSLGYDDLYEFVTFPDRRMWRMVKSLN